MENVRELLDSPNEFFYNTSTRQLYFWPNTTEPLQSLLFEVPQRETVVHVAGMQGKWVRELVLDGLTFKHTSLTFMG